MILITQLLEKFSYKFGISFARVGAVTRKITEDSGLETVINIS